MGNFDRIEQRVNRIGSRKLANVVATLAGAPVPGIFDAVHADALNFVAGSTPVFQCDASQLAAGVEEGADIIIASWDGAPRFTGTVRSVEPDGSGWLLLKLSEAD